MPDGNEKDDEVVCEFFGIKITTKNPNVARILTSDVGKIVNLDVREVKTFLVDDQAEPADDDESKDPPQLEEDE